MKVNVKGSLGGHEIGRHSVEEIKTLQQKAAETLEVRREGRAYLHSDETPSRIDLTSCSRETRVRSGQTFIGRVWF